LLALPPLSCRKVAHLANSRRLHAFEVAGGTIAPLTQVSLPVKSPAMIRLLSILVLLVASQVSAGEMFTATVIEVTDGDTVRVRAHGRDDRLGRIANGQATACCT
jgi:endonuclease YncB( thermonuclease family)